MADSVQQSGPRVFDLVVDEIGYWKHNRIVYGALGKVPQELITLVSALQDGISAAGFSLEQRVYAPHVTLMRNAVCQTLPELIEPITWRGREWTMIKSEQTGNGSVYTPIGCWPLEASE